VLARSRKRTRKEQPEKETEIIPKSTKNKGGTDVIITHPAKRKRETSLFVTPEMKKRAFAKYAKRWKKRQGRKVQKRKDRMFHKIRTLDSLLDVAFHHHLYCVSESSHPRDFIESGMASTAFPLRPAAAIPDKSETTSESTTIEDVKIIVWNVNGVRARLKKDRFLEVIRNQNADMLCLQEVRCGLEQFLRKKDVRKTLEELGYQYIVHQTSKHNVGYAGVAIISKIPCLSHGQGVSNVKLDTEGRVVWTEYEKFVLVNAYAPNSGNELELVTLPKRLEWETELSKLLTRLKETKKKEIFYTGDLNVVHQDDGVWGGITNPRWKQFPSCSLEERTTFQKLVDKHQFLSLKQDRNVPGYTFFSRPSDRIKNRGMILDYSLCTKPFADAYVKNYRLRSEIRGSDHVPQEVIFRASLFPEKTRQKKDPIPLSTTEAEAISSIEGGQILIQMNTSKPSLLQSRNSKTQTTWQNSSRTVTRESMTG
jgi:exodeoxyribonuclease-3